MEEQNTWQEITSTLNALNDETLSELLSSSQQLYDGNYVIAAEPAVYSSLCQYFPLIETVVQDHSDRHFRLNLQPGVPMGTDSETLQVQLGAANITDAIINPERIVALPAYLLRFVPFVGAAPVLIAAALRQAFYFASREDGASQLYPKSGSEVTIDVQSILRLLGKAISRAKFFRIFKNGQMDWFVERADPAHQFVDGQIRRLPNTYLYRGQYLTPGDAADLADWLRANDIQSDPVTVLTKALNTPRNQILQFPYRLPDEKVPAGSKEAFSVSQVVSQALGLPRLDANLSGLCDRLSSHLIRPESFLAVPWYWFQNVLPELGDDLGMLYLMSKNCCYIDWARGQDRDRFWVVGGLETLQGWIGSETLPKRIPHASKSKRGRPRTSEIQPESQYTRDWRQANRELASQYLCRTDTRKSEHGTDWQLRVYDTRLTARDETLRHALSAFLHNPPEPLTGQSLSVFAQNKDIQKLLLEQSRLHPERLCHFETLVNEGICQNETLDEALICHYDTLADGLNCYFETLIQAGICQFDTVINILIKIQNSLLLSENNPLPDTLTSSDPSSGEKKVEGQGKDFDIEVEDQWDFGVLLHEVNPALKDRIVNQGLGLVYLSWLIQGCLSAGVHSPVSLAVSRCLETAKPASTASERLAKLPAQVLIDLVSKVLMRLESGQTGAFAFVGEGGQDLAQLLQGVDDLATQKRLVRRLVDALS